MYGLMVAWAQVEQERDENKTQLRGLQDLTAATLKAPTSYNAMIQEVIAARAYYVGLETGSEDRIHNWYACACACAYYALCTMKCRWYYRLLYTYACVHAYAYVREKRCTRRLAATVLYLKALLNAWKIKCRTLWQQQASTPWRYEPA